MAIKSPSLTKAMRRKLAKNRFKLLAGGKCKTCGYSKCLDALEFHHRNPKEKKFKLSSAMYGEGFSQEEIVAEINKCDLLCANCHREVHFKE